jgi:hypothetical protein
MTTSDRTRTDKRHSCGIGTQHVIEIILRYTHAQELDAQRHVKAAIGEFVEVPVTCLMLRSQLIERIAYRTLDGQHEPCAEVPREHVCAGDRRHVGLQGIQPCRIPVGGWRQRIRDLDDPQTRLTIARVFSCSINRALLL